MKGQPSYLPACFFPVSFFLCSDSTPYTYLIEEPMNNWFKTVHIRLFCVLSGFLLMWGERDTVCSKKRLTLLLSRLFFPLWYSFTLRMQHRKYECFIKVSHARNFISYQVSKEDWTQAIDWMAAPDCMGHKALCCPLFHFLCSILFTDRVDQRDFSQIHCNVTTKDGLFHAVLVKQNSFFKALHYPLSYSCSKIIWPQLMRGSLFVCSKGDHWSASGFQDSRLWNLELGNFH